MDIENVTNFPSSNSILCSVWGQFHILEIAGIIAGSAADKRKGAFKCLNISFQGGFVLALLTPCPASLRGLGST